jgi:hypothetical protein
MDMDKLTALREKRHQVLMRHHGVPIDGKPGIRAAISLSSKCFQFVSINECAARTAYIQPDLDPGL